MNKFLYLLIFIFISKILYCQTISGKVSDSSIGITFNVPNNWKGQQIPQGYIFVSDIDKGFILVTPHNFKTIDEIVENANMGINENNGTVLSLSDKLEINENSVAGIFKGFLEGQAATSFAKSLMSPFGGGVAVFVFVESENYSEKYKEFVNEICNSLKFSEPVRSSLENELEQILNNCRLTYINNYKSGYGSGGIQDKIIIDLCEQGYFNYYDESQVVMNADDVSGYSSGNKNNTGNWNVIARGDQGTLILNFDDGNIAEYNLTFEGEKTFLNGNRFFRTYKDSNVEGTQPDCF